MVVKYQETMTAFTEEEIEELKDFLNKLHDMLTKLPWKDDDAQTKELMRLEHLCKELGMEGYEFS